MGHRRDVYDGDLRAGAASGSGRRTEPSIGGAGVWCLSKDDSEDADILGSDGLSAATADTAPQAGALAGVIDAILKEDKTRPVNLSLWKREAAARLVRDDRSHIARLGGCQPDSMTRNLPASAANLSGLCPDFLSAAMFCPPI